MALEKVIDCFAFVFVAIVAVPLSLDLETTYPWRISEDHELGFYTERERDGFCLVAWLVHVARGAKIEERSRAPRVTNATWRVDDG